MAVNVLHWRAGIEMFYYWSHPVIMNNFSYSNCFPKVRCINHVYYFFCSLKLLIHGDVEANPGPKNLALISLVVIGI